MGRGDDWNAQYIPLAKSEQDWAALILSRLGICKGCQRSQQDTRQIYCRWSLNKSGTNRDRAPSTREDPNMFTWGWLLFDSSSSSISRAPNSTPILSEKKTLIKTLLFGYSDPAPIFAVRAESQLNFTDIYCMSKKSCPIFLVYSLYINKTRLTIYKRTRLGNPVHSLIFILSQSERRTKQLHLPRSDLLIINLQTLWLTDILTDYHRMLTTHCQRDFKRIWLKRNSYKNIN